MCLPTRACLLDTNIRKWICCLCGLQVSPRQRAFMLSPTWKQHTSICSSRPGRGDMCEYSLLQIYPGLIDRWRAWDNCYIHTSTHSCCHVGLYQILIPACIFSVWYQYSCRYFDQSAHQIHCVSLLIVVLQTGSEEQESSTQTVSDRPHVQFAIATHT